MNIKKLLALLLAVVMLLSLAACADTDDDDDDDSGKSSAGSQKDDDEESIVGEWEGELDFGALLNEMMGAADDETAEYFDFDGLTITMIFNFEKNGELSIEADEDSLQDMVDEVVDIMVDGYEKMLKDADMSWEDALGMSEDDFRDAMAEEFDADALEEMTSEIASEGYYVVVDDRIYTDEDEENLENAEEDATEYLEFKLSGDTLTIKDIVSDGESVDEYLPGMLPLKLKRK